MPTFDYDIVFAKSEAGYMRWLALKVLVNLMKMQHLLTGLKYGFTNEKKRRISLVPSDINVAFDSELLLSMLTSKELLGNPEQYMNSFDNFATNSIPKF